MTTEPKPKGRKPKGRKYSESLQVPVTPEFRTEVETAAADMGMTVPAFMRRAAEIFMKDWQTDKDVAADDGWKNR